ncbi:carboxylate-amine ligase [Streptomyces buecherae]|uniref:carboxylate-amine ligase n=1 Tax=Streptomyces buecherae TaxID=2763006 RepID=UPI001C279EB3|nr:YbdK family carboxylate-amine ligase [Streptomyces buecherae]
MSGSEAGRGRRVEADVLTVGVEEEYFLVHPETRAVEPAGPRVLARAAAELGDAVSGEFTEYQIEVKTAPCVTSTEVHRELTRLRAAVARAAAAEGLRVCPSGTPVLGGSGPVVVGDHPRYQTSVDLFRSMMDDYAINALHVHVHLPDRELAALVGNHLRPWLPLLVEMSANSPFHGGRDSGYASWRSVIRVRFPCLGPPPYVDSFADYERTARAMATAGAMPFGELPFWDVRPHPTLPTLEVRCMDVPADAADSAALAAIVRALVVTAAARVRAGDPGPRAGGELLRSTYWYATRDGWPGLGTDAVTGDVLPAPERGRRLLAHVGPALDAHGDHQVVADFLGRLERHGSGAHRQRAAARRSGGLTAVVDDLVGAAPEDGR